MRCEFELLDFEFEFFPQLSFLFDVVFAIIGVGRSDTADTSSLLVIFVKAVDSDASVASAVTDGELGWRETGPVDLFRF